MIDGPTWRHVTTRREARVLQRFTCTTDFPRSPGGRRLPHPRPWEKEAQTLVREAAKTLRPGEIVLMATVGEEPVAAAHLQFRTDGELLEAHHVAAAVAQSARRQGGHLADALLVRAQAICLEQAMERGSAQLVLTGLIHVSNRASQHLVARAGWQPRGVPTNGYQSWFLVVPVQ